jgi:hypothetical protein
MFTRTLTASLRLLQDLHGVLKVSLKVFAHGVQHFDQQGITQGVEHLVSFLARYHQMPES